MAYRDSLIVNFEDKTLEYKNVLLYVIKQFDYEGKTYLYAVDKKTVESNELEVYFLYRIKDDIFNHVDDPEKQSELFQVVSGQLLKDIVNRNINKQNN